MTGKPTIALVYWSETFTVTDGENVVPAVTEAGGCWAKANILALVGVMVITRNAEVNPGEFAAIVYVPTLLMATSPNVFEPSESDIVLVVPLPKLPVFNVNVHR